MPQARSKLGTAGEALARRHLESRGMAWIESNWRCQAGELDLVMRDGDEVVFVEVKLRRGEAAGRAEEAITAAKATKLLKSASWYLAEHPDMGDPMWRVDLLAITLDRSGHIDRISHLVNAVVGE